MVGAKRKARIPHHIIVFEWVCCLIDHAMGRTDQAEQSIDSTPTARKGDIPMVNGARNRLMDGGRK